MTTVEFDSLNSGQPVQIDVDGEKVCLTRVGDEVFAVSNVCTHSYAELSDGEVKGFVIECWLHGGEFDLRTGSAVGLPAIQALETYQVDRQGNTLTVSQTKKEM